MRNSLSIFTLSSMLLLAQSAAGATNGLDEKFGSGGVVLLGPTPVSGLIITSIDGLAIQDDGKIVIAGAVINLFGPGDLPGVGRLNADGTWDTSFGDHGLFGLPHSAASAPFGGNL